MAVSFTVSTKMLPFKRLSWLWIVFQIVVVVNVKPLVSRRGEYKRYLYCISVEGYFQHAFFQRIMFQRPPFLHCILQPYLSNQEYRRKVLEKSLSGQVPSKHHKISTVVQEKFSTIENGS